MTNCIIRKLKESINDEELLPLDAIMIKANTIGSGDDDMFSLGFTKISDTGADVIVTASEGIQLYSPNNITEVDSYNNFNVTTHTSMRFIGNGKIYIKGLYNISAMSLTKRTLSIPPNPNIVQFDIDQLKNHNNLRLLVTNSTIIKGDLSSLKDKPYLNDLSLSGFNNIAGVNVSGDIGNLKTSPMLKRISIMSTNIYGDIFEAVANNNVCEQITLKLAKGLTMQQSPALLPDTLWLLSLNGSNIIPISYSWPSATLRPSTACIFTNEVEMNYNNYLDNVLINFANCQVPEILAVNNYSASPWLYNIRLGGNKTAASDAAVGVLKSKGYHIFINSVEI